MQKRTFITLSLLIASASCCMASVKAQGIADYFLSVEAGWSSSAFVIDHSFTEMGDRMLTNLNIQHQHGHGYTTDISQSEVIEAPARTGLSFMEMANQLSTTEGTSFSEAASSFATSEN